MMANTDVKNQNTGNLVSVSSGRLNETMFRLLISVLTRPGSISMRTASSQSLTIPLKSHSRRQWLRSPATPALQRSQSGETLNFKRNNLVFVGRMFHNIFIMKLV